MSLPGVIYIVPFFREPMDGLLAGMAEGIEEQFEINVVILENGEIPSFAYDPIRKQFNSNLLLAALDEMAPSDSLKVLGVTEVDLFSPVFSYVFGEALLGGKCAIISSFRLHGPVRSKPRCPPLLDRLEKEAVHELGHTFGLRHCADSSCVMSFSKGVQCADRKFAVFCAACRDLMLWFRNAQLPA